MCRCSCTLGLKSSSVMPLLVWAMEHHSTVDGRTHTEKLESSVLMSHTKFSATPNLQLSPSTRHDKRLHLTILMLRGQCCS